MITTLFYISIQCISLLFLKVELPFSSFLFNLFDQYAADLQCADPVTGSFRILAQVVKNCDTKSLFCPSYVTISNSKLN